MDPTQQLLQQIVNAVSLGSMYSLFALGYALVFSVLGLLNLAHSAVFMWGAYIALRLVLGSYLPVGLAMLLGMAGAGLIGVALDRVAFRPLRERNAPRIAQLISSIGAATILVSLAQILFTTQPQGFPLDQVPNQTLEGLPFHVTAIQVIIFGVSLLLMALLRALIMRTKQGQAMRTVAFNQRIAALLGVPVDAIYRLTFFLAGALGGAAGVLFSLNYAGSITPFMGDKVALEGLVGIVLGGMGTIEGAVLGGFVVAGLQVFSVTIGGSDFADAIIFLLLLVILIARPQGLLGGPSSQQV